MKLNNEKHHFLEVSQLHHISLISVTKIAGVQAKQYYHSSSVWHVSLFRGRERNFSEEELAIHFSCCQCPFLTYVRVWRKRYWNYVLQLLRALTCLSILKNHALPVLCTMYMYAADRWGCLRAKIKKIYIIYDPYHSPDMSWTHGHLSL